MFEKLLSSAPQGSGQGKPSQWQQSLKEACEQLASAVDADLLYCRSPIYDPCDLALRSTICARSRRRKNVVLLLTTNGGSPEAAYRMARSLRRAYPAGKFTVIIDWHCKSAGTLLAIGAGEIVMSEFAELGPLDIQLQKPDELAELV